MSDTEQAWADAAKFDPAQGGVSLRQYAAIHLKQPNSGEPWLDDMIRQAKRDEFAGMALQGLLSEGLRDAANNALATGLCSKDDTVSDGVSKLSYTLADAMLEAVQ